MIKKLIFVLFIAVLFSGCNNQNIKTSEQVDQKSQTTNNELTPVSEPDEIVTEKDLNKWPAKLPVEIPQLTNVKIDYFLDNTWEGPVLGQPEKILYTLTLSEISNADIKEYMNMLEENKWKLSTPTIDTVHNNSTSYRAEKGDYVIFIEDNIQGPETNSAYYYVLLSEEASNSLKEVKN